MQLAMHMVTIEDLMPREHFLRKLEAALDLSFVYEETAPLYSKKYGRPAIDPVVIVKYLLVGFLYGIPSERQIERRVQTDIALRWYLGLDLFDRVPDHSTVSQLRRRKPSFRRVFRRLFEEVVGQCIEKGLVSGRVVGADSTHVRANASRASEELVEITEAPGIYWERLDAYEEKELEELERRTGKRRKKRTKQIKRDNRRTHKRVSRTDPESGHLKRPGKPEGPHYLAHQAVDSDYGIIVGQTVTAGDVNDSVPFLGLIEHIHENVVPIQAATADAAYDFPLAHRALGELGIDFFVRPQKTAARVSVQFTRDDFYRDENRDVYLCPIGKELCLRRLARSASGLFLGVSGGSAGLRGLSIAGQMSARERQTRRKKGVRQLLHGRPTAQPGTPFQPGIPGGAEAAAGLVRGLVFRAEARAQLSARFATRLRGSGGPLSLVGNRIEPETDDKTRRMTPEGVFFCW